MLRGLFRPSKAANMKPQVPSLRQRAGVTQDLAQLKGAYGRVRSNKAHVRRVDACPSCGIEAIRGLELDAASRRHCNTARY